MKNYKFLSNLIFLALLTTLSHANSDGFYVGTDASIMLFGDDDLEITYKDGTKKNHKDINSFHYNMKIGYQHFNNNRLEFYYRKNKLDNSKEEIKTKTFGINYEWAFSSLATETIIPYALIGIGGGEVSSSNIKALDNAEVGEANLGVGIHYQFNENMDFQVGYTFTSTGFDNFDNKTTDETSTIDQNKVVVGVAYKF